MVASGGGGVKRKASKKRGRDKPDGSVAPREAQRLSKTVEFTPAVARAPAAGTARGGQRERRVKGQTRGKEERSDEAKMS